MYELWAKKRPVEGVGSPYEFIFSFENENYKFSAIDKLDREIYQEGMIIKDNACILYMEFEKPMIYRRKM